MVFEASSATQTADSDARRLASASNAAVVLPAGAGKTELIARATQFASASAGRQLILTHTHAGVYALRARLARLGVPPQSYTLTTIAGWALKWAGHYPTISGVRNAQPTDTSEWNAVYEGARRVLANPHLAGSVRASYGGGFVDEYQDCTLHQHEILLALSELMPLRVLGDPLQGIFGFTKEPILWSRDVEPSFQALKVEERSWRWAETNPRLGEWLLELREALLEGRPIDLDAAPVHWGSAVTPAAQVAACKARATDEAASVVAILQWTPQCQNLAKMLGGAFSSMDALESRDLLQHAEGLDGAASGCEVAAAILRVARECIAKLPAAMRIMQTGLEKERLPRITAKTRDGQVVRAVLAVAEAPTATNILAAAELIEGVPDAFVHRMELWRGFKRSIAVQRDEKLATFREAAVVVRGRTRENGRAAQPRSVSRTVLVKGLEYDHALILNATSLVAQDFYVAATRGRRTLTVLSDQPVRQFPPPKL